MCPADLDCLAFGFGCAEQGGVGVVARSVTCFGVAFESLFPDVFNGLLGCCLKIEMIYKITFDLNLAPSYIFSLFFLLLLFVGLL